MKCSLCEKEIVKYDPEFNYLKIDDTHEVHICLECVDKFTSWQGSIITELFPTKALKRRSKRE